MAVTLGSTGITFPDATTQTTAAAGGLSAATQAQMEAASSNAVAVTPLSTKWSPGVAKVWIQCDSGTTVYSSLNVSSITDDGTGTVTVTLTTNFSSVNYSVIPGLVWNGGNPTFTCVSNNGPYTTGFQLLTWKSFTLQVDPTFYTAVCYGDQ